MAPDEYLLVLVPQYIFGSFLLNTYAIATCQRVLTLILICVFLSSILCPIVYYRIMFDFREFYRHGVASHSFFLDCDL